MIWSSKRDGHAYETKKTILFGEEKTKTMEMHIEDICIDSKNDNKKFDDKIGFFKQNYSKI